MGPTDPAPATADVVLRHLRPHDLDAYYECLASAFGTRLDAAAVEREAALLELDRTVVALERGELVGAAAVHRLPMTVPGGARPPVAAVSDVAVVPTHRRRGILRAMMGCLLSDAREAGEALSCLMASEAGIYGRFGYGPATFAARVSVDRRRAVLLPTLDASPAGRVTMLRPDQARSALPEIYGACLEKRAGEVDRLGSAWDHLFPDPGEDDASRSRFYAVLESAGTLEGYVAYSYLVERSAGRRRRVVRVDELVGASGAAVRTLWGFVVGLDLVDVLAAPARPLDDPLRFALVDSRAVEVSAVVDRSWVRLVDVAAALGGRRYGDAGRLVLEVVGAPGAEGAGSPDGRGVYLIDTDGDGVASVERIGTPEREDRAHLGGLPRLSLDLAALGSLYLGGVPAGLLVAAGRATPSSEEAVGVAARLFASAPAPFCTADF